LTGLYLRGNQLTGLIDENICNIIDNNCYTVIGDNQLCPPYPSCSIEYYVVDQDTSGCN